MDDNDEILMKYKPRKLFIWWNIIETEKLDEFSKYH
jgi:hypothetical protein